MEVEGPTKHHRFKDATVYVASSKPNTAKGKTLDDLEWTPLKTVNVIIDTEVSHNSNT